MKHSVELLANTLTTTGHTKSLLYATFSFCFFFFFFNFIVTELHGCLNLQRCGVKFPQRSKEAPLMLTPAPPHPSTTQSSSSSMNLMSIGSFRRLDETMATEIESLRYVS